MDLQKAGFPRHGHHCQRCKAVMTEIRIDEDGNAVVTEIEVRPPTPDRENDVSSDEDLEHYMDEHDEEDMDEDDDEDAGSSDGQHRES